MKYWLFENNQVVGPYDRDELTDVPGFSAESLVCPEGRKGTHMGDWQRAGVVAELAETLLKRSRVPAGVGGDPAASLVPPEPTLRDLAVLGTLQEKVSLLESSLNQLHDELQTRDEEIASLKVDLDQKAQEAATLQGKVGALEEKIGVAEALKSEIEKTQQEQSQEAQSIEELKAQIDNARSDIQQSISKVEEEQSMLRQELKDEISSAKASSAVFKSEDDRPPAIAPGVAAGDGDAPSLELPGAAVDGIPDIAPPEDSVLPDPPDIAPGAEGGPGDAPALDALPEIAAPDGDAPAPGAFDGDAPPLEGLPEAPPMDGGLPEAPAPEAPPLDGGLPEVPGPDAPALDGGLPEAPALDGPPEMASLDEGMSPMDAPAPDGLPSIEEPTDGIPGMEAPAPGMEAGLSDPPAVSLDPPAPEALPMPDAVEPPPAFESLSTPVPADMMADAATPVPTSTEPPAPQDDAMVDLTAAADEKPAKKSRKGVFFFFFLLLGGIGAAVGALHMGFLDPALLGPVAPMLAKYGIGKPQKPSFEAVQTLPTEPPTSDQARPAAPAPMNKAVQDRTQDAIALAQRYPVGGSGKTLGQVLEPRKSPGLLSPWSAKSLGGGLYEVNFYSKPGSTPEFQFEIQLDAKQVRGLTSKSHAVLNGEAAAGSKTPPKRKPRPRSRKRRSSGSGLLADPFSNVGSGAPKSSTPKSTRKRRTRKAPAAKRKPPASSGETILPPLISENPAPRPKKRKTVKAQAAPKAAPSKKSKDELTLDELLLPGVSEAE